MKRPTLYVRGDSPLISLDFSSVILSSPLCCRALLLWFLPWQQILPAHLHIPWSVIATFPTSCWIIRAPRRHYHIDTAPPVFHQGCRCTVIVWTGIAFIWQQLYLEIIQSIYRLHCGSRWVPLPKSQDNVFDNIAEFLKGFSRFFLERLAVLSIIKYATQARKLLR